MPQGRAPQPIGALVLPRVNSPPGIRPYASIPVMANALGVGLIGAGMIGQGHAYALRLLAEDGEVRPVAVTDLSPDAVDAARAICPFERARHDAQSVIDDPDVDALVIV